MSKAAKILHLTIKKQWFDMIASGEKKEEYREIKEYWVSRLFYRDFDQVVFRNGYGANAPQLTFEVLNIAIAAGKKEWGAKPGQNYFVIRIGKQISNNKNQ